MSAKSDRAVYSAAIQMMNNVSPPGLHVRSCQRQADILKPAIRLVMPEDWHGILLSMAWDHSDLALHSFEQETDRECCA